MGEYAIYDAHNHLQDERLRGELPEVMRALARVGMRKCVVNGTREEDWEAVADLARHDQRVVASFGLHPWYIAGRSKEWFSRLEKLLGSGGAGVGEIGLDKWIEGADFEEQEKVFREQWRLAAELNLPVSVHCLKAWGPLVEMLRQERRPECGFLLHSYGGSRELIEPLVKLGGYFSISGYFANERKAKQREAFKAVPRERLLIETDAPDMAGPAEWTRYALADGKLNHPANLERVYKFAAGLFEMAVEELAGQVEENFRRLFGGLLR